MFLPTLTEIEKTELYSALRSIDDSYSSFRSQMFEYFDSQKLRAPEINDFIAYAHFVENTTNSRGKNYEPTTYNQILSMIIATLAEARTIARRSIISEGIPAGTQWPLLAQQFDAAKEKLLKKRFILKDSRPEAADNLWLEMSEIQKIIDKCDAETALIVRVMALTGIRGTELQKLTWTNLVVENDSSIILQVIDSRFDRNLILPISFYTDIQVVFPPLMPDGTVFYNTKSMKRINSSSLETRIGNAIQDAGLPLPTGYLKLLRNSFAYFLLNHMHIELTQVARYLGLQKSRPLEKFQLTKGERDMITFEDLPTL
jgi:integrase